MSASHEMPYFIKPSVNLSSEEKQLQYQQALAAFQNTEKQQPGLPGVIENIDLMKKMLGYRSLFLKL